MNFRYLLFAALLVTFQAVGNSPSTATAEISPFAQLTDKWAPPNDYRTASGAPGHKYWQQQADHSIQVELDEVSRRLKGRQTIVYTNNSPDRLSYLWLQLDQNRFRADSKSALGAVAGEGDRISFTRARRELGRDFGGGHDIIAVRTSEGQALPHRIVDAMMRVDLPAAVQPGQRVSLDIEWQFVLPEIHVAGSRGGYETFEDSDSPVFTIAQWFPRMAAYTDRDGWVLEPFLGGAEFAAEFGNYRVEITVPADHIVAATGALSNAAAVLTDSQRERLNDARKSDAPVLIVTPEEARANESSKSTQTKTWIFEASNVRDFAFASSRRFIWDAMGVDQSDGPSVMAMSFYPDEANPLWGQYSTHAIAHTLEVYGRHTFPYPYPVAQSVNGAVYGMEYPMIGFSGPRPEMDDDGTRSYKRSTKHDLISVIVHETGHNYFPMIVNSNERHYTWMDEGLNSFLEYLALQSWEPDFPADWGVPSNLADYMKSDRQPIMSPPETIRALGDNAYSSVGAGLILLRETILGQELFDLAFREYADRWKFKRPTPEDFFRTMEDASGVDLDWFWRGWFYETKSVDMGISNVVKFTLDDGNPESQSLLDREKMREDAQTTTKPGNSTGDFRTDRYPELLDFYNENDEFTVTDKQRNEYDEFLEGLETWQRDLLTEDRFFYRLDLENIGGMVVPLRLRLKFADDTASESVLPAEFWRYDSNHASRWIVSEQPIIQFSIDPYRELPDTDRVNNEFPREAGVERLPLYDDLLDESRNLMKDVTVERKAPGD